MPKIKTREVAEKSIKTIDRGKVLTQKTKDSIVNIKRRSEDSTTSNENSPNEYAINKINNASRETIYTSNNIKNKGNNAVKTTKNNVVKVKGKLKTIKTKLAEKQKIKQTKKGIKTSSAIVRKEVKTTKETMKASKKALQYAKESAKKTYRGIKAAIKITYKSVKAIILGTKALITALIAGGWVAIVIIILICLIGLLCSSIFGIFFSGEKTSNNSITMRDAIIECNQEFSNKIEYIQNTNPHDEYVLDGSITPWKDILMIYTVKQNDSEEVLTMDNRKKQILKDIFWDMNSITYDVKTEIVIEQGINYLEMPKEVQKRVLHIKVTSKTVEQMKLQYHFTPEQLNQINELSSEEYSSLWSGVIYGIDSGEYTTWRQKGATWSNIKMGNSNSTVGDIGCFVTSIAILIQKSKVDNPIIPFNPGTFVEALNNNNGFDSDGNLYYSAVNKVVPNFKYIGNVSLSGKSRSEKLSLIKEYFNNGYYLAVEVKGATPGNQHWVAIIGIDENNIIMIDPATEHTDLWSAYEWGKTSQFAYFKAN